MQQTIVITDLTTMGGDRVCIVGIGSQSRCIRPVLPPPGVRRRHLYIRKHIIFRKLAVRPRAKVRLKFYRVPLTPPHIEDLGFEPSSVAYQGLCDDAEWEAVLKASSFLSVQDMYDGCLQEGRWVEPGANTRSLGTVSQVQVISVNLQEWSGERRYRLYFKDETGHQYNPDFLHFRKLATFCQGTTSRF